MRERARVRVCVCVDVDVDEWIAYIFFSSFAYKRKCGHALSFNYIVAIEFDIKTLFISFIWLLLIHQRVDNGGEEGDDRHEGRQTHYDHHPVCKIMYNIELFIWNWPVLFMFYQAMWNVPIRQNPSTGTFVHFVHFFPSFIFQVMLFNVSVVVIIGANNNAFDEQCIYIYTFHWKWG